MDDIEINDSIFSLLFFFSRVMRGDPRNIIEYRDLDAPDDVDFF